MVRQYNRRSEAEIIAEHEEKARRARERLALREAKDNPILAPIQEEIDRLTSEIRNADKILGEGPQSAKASRLSHVLWINVIDTQAVYSQAVKRFGEEQRENLQVALGGLVQRIANGEEVGQEEVEKALDSFEEPEELVEARRERDIAQAAREAHTRAKKAPKARTASE